MTDEDAVLLTFLDAQRDRAFAILADLDTGQLTTPVLPSGWTPLGLVEHLGHAERHWFQGVLLDQQLPLPWPDDADDQTRETFTTTRSPEVVFAFYRDQIDRANAILAATTLDTAPLGRHGHGDEALIVDLRFIVLHMIEETARHLGHLDAARELIDGRTGLGADPL